jgi:hypothetical protein
LGFIARSEIAGFWTKTYQILQFRDIQKRRSENKIITLEVFQAGPTRYTTLLR